MRCVGQLRDYKASDGPWFEGLVTGYMQHISGVILTRAWPNMENESNKNGQLSPGPSPPHSRGRYTPLNLNHTYPCLSSMYIVLNATYLFNILHGDNMSLKAKTY